jgi:hypothetical protein
MHTVFWWGNLLEHVNSEHRDRNILVIWILAR